MVYGYELKKLVLAPALMGFMMLSMIFNIGLIVWSDTAGADHLDVDITDMIDIFDEFDTRNLAEGYIARLGITGEYAENIRKKYENLQMTVDEKGKNDESLSVYFGLDTQYMHRLLFQRVFGAIAVESCLMAIFAALLSTGYEHSRNTENVVYASKTGRKVQQKKFLATLTMAGGSFLCLASVTLILYFLCFDYSYVWNASVSSLYNSEIGNFTKPFITWEKFTVLQFVFAYTIITGGLTVCFAWFGFSVGTFVRNEYVAVATSVTACIFLAMVEPILPYGSQIRNLSNLTPVRLLINIGDWFTDSYANILWRNFECLGMGLSLVLLAAMVNIAMICFRRRDLT